MSGTVAAVRHFLSSLRHGDKRLWSSAGGDRQVAGGNAGYHSDIGQSSEQAGDCHRQSETWQRGGQVHIHTQTASGPLTEHQQPQTGYYPQPRSGSEIYMKHLNSPSVLKQAVKQVERRGQRGVTAHFHLDVNSFLQLDPRCKMQRQPFDLPSGLLTGAPGLFLFLLLPDVERCTPETTCCASTGHRQNTARSWRQRSF